MSNSTADREKKAPKLLPSLASKDRIARAVRLLEGTTGKTIVEMQSKGLLSGCPPELIVAFITPSFLTANTTDATSGLGAEVAFHEIGLYQIPAGPALRDAGGKPTGAAPAPNRNAEHNTWGKLHDDAQVVAALGRAASMREGAWQTDERAQHAVGLAMLRDDFRAARAKLERLLPALAPPADGWDSPWGAACMFLAFSAGPGRVPVVCERFAERVATADPKKRFGALVHAACVDLHGGWEPPGKPGRHSNPVHTILRTWQKFAFAEDIAKKTSQKVGFFETFLGARRAACERTIARASLGLRPLPADAPGPIDWSAP